MTKKICINNDWTFTDNNKKELVSIPHTPKIEKLDVSFNYQGEFSYEKLIPFEEEYKNHKIFLEFEGVMTNASIYANGELISTHFGGYLPILVDITNHFVNNSCLIKVIVNNYDDKDTPPGKPTKGLDFLYYGGIYRNVNLIIKPKIYITHPVELAEESGISILTYLQDNKWNLDTCSVFYNSINNVEDYKYSINLLDNKDNVILNEEYPSTINPNSLYSEKRSFTLDNINEWSVDSPYLYTLNLSITSKYGTDVETLKIGFREAIVDKEGFKLNGKLIRLFGVNRGQQYPYIGIAASDEAHRREARMLKESGINCIRLAHYPHNPAFFDECDKLGLILLDPAPGWQFIGGKTWKNRFVENVRDMVKRDRNHASVIIFEITPNESGWPTRKGDKYFKKLNAYVKELCPTALTAGDTVGRRDGKYIGFDIPFTGEDKLSKRRTLYADKSKKFLTREFGDWCYGGNQSTSRVSRGDGELAQQIQLWNFHFTHNDNYKKDNIIGDLVWEGIDHNRGYYPAEPISKSGIFDIFRVKKLSYNLFKSQKTPISADDYCILPAFYNYQNKHKLVFYSNLSKLVLKVNGKVVATKLPDDGKSTPFNAKNPVDEFYWLNNEDHIEVSKRDNPLAKHVKMCMFNSGNAENFTYPPFTFKDLSLDDSKKVEVDGYIEDKLIKTITLPLAEKATKLDIVLEDWNIPLKPNNNDFIFVRVIAKDDNGNVDYNYSDEVSMDIEGGNLIGHNKIKSEQGIASFMIKANSKSLKLSAVSSTLMANIKVNL